MCSPGNRAPPICCHSESKLSFWVQIWTLPTMSPISKYRPTTSHCNAVIGYLLPVTLCGIHSNKKKKKTIVEHDLSTRIIDSLVCQPWTIQIGDVDVETCWQCVVIFDELSVGSVRNDILRRQRTNWWLLLAQKTVKSISFSFNWIICEYFASHLHRSVAMISLVHGVKAFHFEFETCLSPTSLNLQFTEAAFDKIQSSAA